jgi:hypothetical protein
MAKGSRTGDETPRRAKRRRRPAVLELKASEVKPNDAKPRQEKPDAKSSEKGEPAAGSAWQRIRSQAGTMNFGGAVSLPLIATGIASAVAGALIVFLLMPPRVEGADPRVGDLAGEVANLSQRIEALAKRPAPASAPDQSGLGERIDKLTAAIGEAEQRLAAVEKRPEPKAPDLSAVDRRTAAMEGTLKELRGGLNDLKRIAEQAPASATPQSVEGIASRIGGLEERIAALAAAPAAAPVAPATPTAGAREFIALNSLTGAVRSGRPFTKELDAARTLLGERAAPLAAIAPFAAGGLPTVAELDRQFSALAHNLLRRPDSDGNFFDRLMTNAARLVEVRRVGEPEGNSVGAIVARAETKLSRGDLVGAIVEVEALPEPAKSRAAKWIAAAKQRRDAEAVVAKALEASLSGNPERGKP